MTCQAPSVIPVDGAVTDFHRRNHQLQLFTTLEDLLRRTISNFRDQIASTSSSLPPQRDLFRQEYGPLNMML
jgi:hypothetical protein